MYTDYDKVDHHSRVVAYAKAMEALAQKYPDDDEAQIHYALALNTSASPADKTYSSQLKGAAILEPIALRQPLHPGVAHYLIHLYDYPAIADKGIEAARRYAKIAPDAPHALHMPSHIFTRVGYWSDSIASNVASARSAKELSDLSDRTACDGLSGLCLSAARTRRQGQSRSRRDGRRSPASARLSFPGLTPRPSRRHAMPWSAATGRPPKIWRCVRPRSPTCRRSPILPARSEPHGLAIPKRPNPISPNSASFATSFAKPKDAYWSEQVDIQARIASAWLLYAEGKKDEALKAMSDAADAEDRTEKHPVTPGVPKPARELYGEMLLDSGNAKDALTAFEATLKKEPNRLGACRRGESRSPARRHRQSARLFWQGRRAGRERGKHPHRGRRCAQISRRALNREGR